MPKWLCCCCGSDDEGSDHEHLIDEGATRGGGGISNREYISDQTTPHTAVNGRTTRQQAARSAEDEETALLNRILDQTQQNIIDVSNMEGIGVGPDFMPRSAKYDELVKRHDHAQTRRRSSLLGANRSLLTDAENHLSDFLSRPPPSLATLTATRQLAAQVSQAIRDGIKVTYQGNLVVHMTLS
uniref:Late endosomal/lysosomal adaptor and MAPK and MTOR activator 1 n=1 Tax=Plectus sambesii TaxID=2011161 RepID=A0A914XDI1_9BILA